MPNTNYISTQTLRDDVMTIMIVNNTSKVDKELIENNLHKISREKAKEIIHNHHDKELSYQTYLKIVEPEGVTFNSNKKVNNQDYIM